MTTTTTEIAPDLFRISTFVPDHNLRFNQFLARDDDPLLFHTGMRALFPAVQAAVSRLVDPRQLRWIAFSHFEADECGALNEWLALAPSAQPACSLVGAMVSVNDVALRPARALEDGEVIATGTQRFRFVRTPHVPHCWEAGLLFEETHDTLLCSDLLNQDGDVPAVTEDEGVVELFRASLAVAEDGPFAQSFPYTPHTDAIVRGLADRRPRVLAAMHGAAFRGDGQRVLHAVADVLRETLGAGVPAP